jgi:hypothetical protein
LRNHFFVVIPNPQGDDKVLEAARQDALAHLLHTVPGAYIPLPDKSLLEHILKTIPEPNTDELPLSTLQAFTLAMLFSHVATTDESIQQASDLADALGHELAVEELAFGRFTAIELARSFANSHFGRNALGTLTEFDDESRLSTYIVRGEGRRAATDTEVFDYLSDRAKMTEMPRNFMP